MNEKADKKEEVSLQNQQEKQDNTENNQPEPNVSKWFRLVIFLQFLIFAITYLVIWYYPHKNEVGNFVWNPEALSPYFFMLAGVTVFVATITLILPSIRKSLTSPAVFMTTVISIFLTTVFFRFLFTFILVTLHATGSFSFPVDPFPFLKWAKFLIIII